MYHRVKNWDSKNGTLYYRETPVLGITPEDIVAASKAPEVKTRAKISDLTSLLGAAWDCCVVVREKLAMPTSPHYAAISKVANAFQDSLPDFEKFLRPTAKLGLPPAK